MKPTLYSLIAAAAACAMANAETAYTTPVGYVTLGDTTANLPSVKGLSDVLLSAPLDRPTAYAGLVASITNGNEINLQASPNFAVDSWIATPHIVKIKSGAKNGFYAMISSNDVDTLTVMLPSGQDLTGVASGDAISINPAWTAKSFFAGSALPADTELFQYAGTSSGINLANDFAYVWDGTDWLDTGTGDPVDPVIYPGEMFILRNNGATAIDDIVVTGEVPTSGFTNFLTNNGAGQQDIPVGVFSPIDETLADSGITAIAQPDDELNIYDNTSVGFNKANSIGLIFDGTDWLDSGTGDPVPPTFKLKSGEGFIYRRASGAPSANWTVVPSYLPLQ